MSESENDIARSVDRALATAFPNREIKDVRSAGPSWNDRNETVRVEFRTGDAAYLKVATDGEPARIRREFAVIGYVAVHCDVVVPSVIGRRVNGDTPYLATAPMPGDTLAHQWPELSRSERAGALRRVGAGLASLHSERFERHGQIVGGDSEELILDTGAWTDVLIDRIELIRQIASSDRFSGYFDEVIAAVRANRDRLDEAPATLVHGDPAMPNLVLQDQSVGLLDWEMAHIGDPARDLHRAHDQLLTSRDMGDDDSLASALDAGYRTRAGSLPAGRECRAPIYDAVRFLGTAGFFDKVVQFSDVPAEDVAAWIDAEMSARLADL